MQRLLGAPDRHWRLGRNLGGALQGGSQHGFGCIEHFVDQAIAQRFLRRQTAPGVGQLFHHRQWHEFGQALQRAHVGHHANVDFLNAKKCIGGGVTDAAGRHHVHRAAYAAALDGGYHRHAQRLQFGEGGLHVGQQIEHGGPAFGALVVHGNRAGKGLQRHAGAEMLAGAADDQHARRAVPVQLGQHLVELAPEGRVHGVQRLGLVEHQMGDVLVCGEGKTLHGEGLLSAL